MSDILCIVDEVDLSLNTELRQMIREWITSKVTPLGVHYTQYAGDRDAVPIFSEVNMKTFGLVGRFMCLTGIKVDQEKLLQADHARCIRLTAELLISKVPLKVKIDKGNNLIEGYEEYLVAHVLGHTTIQVS